MALGFWQTLASLQAAGTAVAATTTRTSMTAGSTQAQASLSPNALKYAGDQLLFEAAGVITTIVTTPGTFRIDLAINTVANFDTLAIPLNIVANTTVPWYLRAIGTIRAVGTTGNIIWQGIAVSQAFLNTALPATGPGAGIWCVPYNTAPVVGANFSTTVSQPIDVYSTQTINTAGSTIQLLSYNLTLMTATGF